MLPSIVEEQKNRLSPFLRFDRKSDKFLIESTSNHADYVRTNGIASSVSAEVAKVEDSKDKETIQAPMTGLTYLRVELTRIRPGMADYLMRISTPLYPNQENTNTIVTLRGSKRQGTNGGAKGTAVVIGKEMRSRGDSTYPWEKLNTEMLGKMLLPGLKFFSSNVNAETLQFTTEAL